MEARGPRGRGGRSLHCELAGATGLGRWRQASVRPRRRHPAHRVGTGRRRGTGHHRVCAPGPRSTQYFEMFGSRALYHEGWKAVTFKPFGPLYDDGINWNAPFDEDRWELYHVAVDPAEIHDLAALHPDRLADMIERWWDEARRNQVLPLDNRVLHTLVHPKPDRRSPHLS